MTPTPASEARNLLQIVIVTVDLYDRNGAGAVPLSVIHTWIQRLRTLVAVLEVQP